jgi:hypothetical protein
MSSSSSVVLKDESERSQSCKAGPSSVLPKLVIGVVVDVEEDIEVDIDVDIEVDDGPEFAVEEAAAAAADVEANDDPALGGCGSGVMLVRRVSHAPAPPSGLRLRSRSPSPSRRCWRRKRCDRSRWLETRFRTRKLSDIWALARL